MFCSSTGTAHHLCSRNPEDPEYPFPSQGNPAGSDVNAQFGKFSPNHQHAVNGPLCSACLHPSLPWLWLPALQVTVRSACASGAGKNRASYQIVVDAATGVPIVNDVMPR